MEDRYISDDMPGICSQEDFDHDFAIWRKECHELIDDLYVNDKDMCNKVSKLIAMSELFMKLLWDKHYTYTE